MREERVRLLQGISIFGGISEQPLQFLLERCPVKKVAQGHFFFREDDPADSMFVLESGKAVVLKTRDNRHYLIHEIDRYESFGEMALIECGLRSASVLAVEACTVIEILNSALLELYHEDLEQFTLIQMNMGREVSRRFRDLSNRLFDAKVEAKPVDNGITYPRYTLPPKMPPIEP